MGTTKERTQVRFKTCVISSVIMGVDDYTLGRDYRASARLHLQHHLWSEAFMYMLNPSIPTTSEGLAIAEVGTGTGIWLFEVDRRLPAPASVLCGIDISDAQFPRPEWLPPSTEFHQCDAFDPSGPPAELIGKFDIVHMRLFVAIIKDNDPASLIRFCAKLLKPGGYIQWDEHEPSEDRVHSHHGSPVEGTNLVLRMTQTHKQTAWVATLPRLLEQEGGFRVIDVDRRPILPWQRGFYLDNYCMLADEFVERARMGGPGIGNVDDYYARISQEVPREKQLGSWMDLTLQIVVAQKL